MRLNNLLKGMEECWSSVVLVNSFISTLEKGLSSKGINFGGGTKLFKVEKKD